MKLLIFILLIPIVNYGQTIKGVGQYELGKSTVDELINSHPEWKTYGMTHIINSDIQYIYPNDKLQKVFFADAIGYEIDLPLIDEIKFDNAKLWYYKNILYKIELTGCPDEFIEAFFIKYGKGVLKHEYGKIFTHIYSSPISYAEINHNGGVSLIIEDRHITKQMYREYNDYLDSVHKRAIAASTDLLNMKVHSKPKDTLDIKPDVYENENVSIIKLARPISLDLIANVTGTDTETLRRWNPYYDLFLNAKYPKEFYELRIPTISINDFIRQKARLEHQSENH